VRRAGQGQKPPAPRQSPDGQESRSTAGIPERGREDESGTTNSAAGPRPGSGYAAGNQHGADARRSRRGREEARAAQAPEATSTKRCGGVRGRRHAANRTRQWPPSAGDRTPPFAKWTAKELDQVRRRAGTHGTRPEAPAGAAPRAKRAQPTTGVPAGKAATTGGPAAGVTTGRGSSKGGKGPAPALPHGKSDDARETRGNVWRGTSGSVGPLAREPAKRRRASQDGVRASFTTTSTPGLRRRDTANEGKRAAVAPQPRRGQFSIRAAASGAFGNQYDVTDRGCRPSSMPRAGQRPAPIAGGGAPMGAQEEQAGKPGATGAVEGEPAMRERRDRRAAGGRSAPGGIGAKPVADKQSRGHAEKPSGSGGSAAMRAGPALARRGGAESQGAAGRRAERTTESATSQQKGRRAVRAGAGAPHGGAGGPSRQAARAVESCPVREQEPRRRAGPTAKAPSKVAGGSPG